MEHLVRISLPLLVLGNLFVQDSSTEDMSLTDQLAFFEMEADAMKKVNLQRVSTFPSHV